MSHDVELLVDAKAQTGEGPLWDADAGVLWWLDIPGRQLHRFDPGADVDRAVELPREVGAVVLRRSGGMVAAAVDGFCTLDPDTGALDLFAAVEADDPGTRMNDGKCDAEGRFWAGTMEWSGEKGRGSFYRLDPDHTVHRMVEGVAISNGLGWSPDGRTLYYADTFAFSVDAFDFDLESGSIDNRRPVVAFDGSQGLPDGLCVDAEGWLWVALWGGGAVRRYAPDGTPGDVIELPCDNVTCPSFGGPDLGDLYITTATSGLTPEQLEQQPAAGALFRCRPGVTGTLPHAYAG